MHPRGINVGDVTVEFQVPFYMKFRAWKIDARNRESGRDVDMKT
jgi:hypothetical protein